MIAVVAIVALVFVALMAMPRVRKRLLSEALTFGWFAMIILLWLGPPAVVIFIIWHFVAKFW